MDFFVHVSSKTAVQYYADSNSCDFTIPLPRQLNLTGAWNCCLKSFYCTKRPGKSSLASLLMVCSDMCIDSIVNDKTIPVLGQLPLKFQLKSPLTESYIPLRRNTISAINIYLTNENGTRMSFDLGAVNCTLHFRRDQH